MEDKIKSHIKEYGVLYLIILLNAVYFGFVILYNAGFANDDYYVLYSVVKNRPFPVSVDPMEFYFLFVRPVSFFSFWLDSVFWPGNPAAMKIFSLFIHMLYMVLIYSALEKTAGLFKINFNKSIAFFLLLILTFHIDTMMWIDWICNRTELLCAIFYVSSVVLAAGYLTSGKENIIKLYGYVICYLLSVFSKATSLHLPILVLFLLSLYGEFDKTRLKKLKRVSLVLGIIVPAYFIINWICYSEYANLISLLWKKPFAAIGIWLFVIIPFWAGDVYFYFVSNKMAAAATAVFIITAAVFYLRSNKDKIRWVFLFVILNLIIFFPRLAADGAYRTNSIMVFWFLTALFYFVSKMSGNKWRLIYLLFAVYAGLHLYFDISVLKENRSHNKKIEQTVTALNKKYDIRKSKIAVFAAFPESANLPFQLHYDLYKSPGRIDMPSPPVLAAFLENKQNAGRPGGKRILCEIKNGELTVRPLDENAWMFFNYLDNNGVKFPIAEQKNAKSRGLSYLRIKVPDKYLDSSVVKVYFDGEEWKEL